MSNNNEDSDSMSSSSGEDENEDFDDLDITDDDSDDDEYNFEEEFEKLSASINNLHSSTSTSSSHHHHHPLSNNINNTNINSSSTPPPLPPGKKPSHHDRQQHSLDNTNTNTNTNSTDDQLTEDAGDEYDDSSYGGGSVGSASNTTDSPLKQATSATSSATSNNNNSTPPPVPQNKPRRVSTKPSSLTSSPATTTTTTNDTNSSTKSAVSAGAVTTSTTTTTSTSTTSATTSATSTSTTTGNKIASVAVGRTERTDSNGSTGSGSGSGSPTNSTANRKKSSKQPNQTTQQQHQLKVIDDGMYRYTHIPPHRLVYTIETQVRMLNSNEEQNNQNSDDQFATESSIEPFIGQLPLPPNCNLFKQALRFKSQLEELNHHSHPHNGGVSMNQLHGVGNSSTTANRKLSNTSTSSGATRMRKQSVMGAGATSRKQSIKQSSNTNGTNTAAQPQLYGAIRHVQSVKDAFPDDLLPGGAKGIPIRIGLSKQCNTTSNNNNSTNGTITMKKSGGDLNDSNLLYKLPDQLNKLDDIPFPPYNSIQLSDTSLKYIYEDHWQVEQSRPLLYSTLLSPQTLSTSTTNTTTNTTESTSTATTGAAGGVDRSKWRTRLMNKYPVMQELTERLHPLWRTLSFGELFNAGRKDVRKKLNDDHTINIIHQHLLFEGLKRTKQSLEEEYGKKYIGIDIDQSLLNALLKESIKKSEKLMDTIISDKYSTLTIQKSKNTLIKELDEQLSELGITSDEFGLASSKRDAADVNIWKEPERQNEIVEFDPVSKFEQFQAGSLNRIVERLTIPSQDQAFIDVFLHTYMAIASPEIVLSKLIQRFKVPSTFTGDLKNGIQSAVIRVLLIWIENHFHHFTNNMLQRIQSFLDEQVLIHAKLNKSRKKINEIITQMTKTQNSNSNSSSSVGGITGGIGLGNTQNNRSNNDKIPDPIIPWNRIFSSELCIEDVDGEEMARQLCLYEFDMYYSIKSEELLNQAWRKPKLKHRSTNVLNMMLFFDHISMWIASLICRGQSTYARKHTYKMLIIVCEQLRKMNNFNTLRAVLNGFDNGAVKRLKDTRSELGQKSKDAEQQLKQLMSEENNFKKYKEALKTSSFPAIPYLGVHLQDLQYIEENHNDYVKNTNRNGAELINWIKRESLFEVIKEIKHFQNPIGYKFVKVFQIQELIRTMPFRVSTNQIMIQSYKAEPPQGAGSNFI